MSRITVKVLSSWLPFLATALFVAGLSHDALANQAYRYVFSSIQYPYGVMTVPYSINNSGTIVGAVAFSNLPFCGKTCVAVWPGWEGFLLAGSTYTPITYPGATGTVALGIDEAGDVVGGYADYAGYTHGFLYHAGSYTSIDFPGAKDTLVTGILDTGTQITGTYIDSSSVQHGFYTFLPLTFETFDVAGASLTWGTDMGWDCGGPSARWLQTVWVPFQDYGVLNFDLPVQFPNAVSTVANGMNPTCNTNVIAGYYVDSGYKDHGFLNTGLAWLTLDVPFSGVTATFAQDVNDSQQVVGYYVAFGQTYGFVANRQPIVR